MNGITTFLVIYTYHVQAIKKCYLTKYLKVELVKKFLRCKHFSKHNINWEKMLDSNLS